MSKKSASIPVNLMANEFGSGIAIDRISVKDLGTAGMEDAKRSHREDGHSFFLLEKGSVSLEVDFRQYTMGPSSILYMHPSQVHRILTFKNVTVSSWSITEELLNPDYLRLLEAITPAKPLVLSKEAFSLISEAVALCLSFFQRKEDRLYHSILKDCCNALVALVAAQYQEHGVSADALSRSEIVTKDFKRLLEQQYVSLKRPAAYAQKLHLSTPYLNECVRNTTGHPVSFHIQQRVILEAKRLLAHSDKAIKEIAAVLGYDDHAYFSRLFNKLTGMSAVAFRNKILD